MTKTESYEKENDLGDYKYDFLMDKNVFDDIGFIPLVIVLLGIRI